MATARDRRQQTVRELVREGSVRTQNELVEALRGHGFDVTQATVSRDIAELELRKNAKGVYALPEDQRLQALVQVAVRQTRRAGNQVIVLTEPGSAPSVAAAMDATGRDGLLGTIAGDDTVLVIMQDDESGEKFQEYIDVMLG